MLPKRLITAVFLVILFSRSAWADVPSSVQTYTTWGDFDIVVNTFERVALMASDSTYHGLFFGIIILAMVFGIIAAFGRGFFTGQSHPMAWVQVFGTIIIGVIIYQVFIQKTDQIVIYDEMLNLQKTVANVPDGLILLAGLSNKIEKGLVDIIWTSSDPYSFKESAGGSIFNIIKNAYSKNVNLNGMPNDGEYIKPTLQNYIDDCLFYEMSRPGNAININDFNNTANLENILALAQSDAISTVIYNATFPSGRTGTCTECWNEINNYLVALTPTSPAVVRFYTETCGMSGLLNVPAAAGPDIAQTTSNKMSAFISALLGSTVNKSQLVTQKLIADQLWKAINEGDSKLLANRKAGVSMAGMGNMANDWIPIIKGLVFAIFIGLFPFVALLIPTPLFGRAISFMFGAFLFLTAWGICDALIHSFAMDKAVALFTEISTTGLGLNSHLMFETEASKALAMFGAARWSSMMLAGVLSAMMARFGGYAMSQFATQMSMPRMQGAEAEALVSSPDSKARKLAAIETSMPSQALSNEYGINSISQIEAYRKASSLKGDSKAIDELGHGNLNTAVDRKAHANAVGAVSDEARATALGVDGARKVSRTGAIKQKEYAENLGEAGAYTRGSVDGAFDRITSEADSQYLQKYGDAHGQQHGLDRERATAVSYMKQGIAEQIANGQISEKTQSVLNRVNDTPNGRQMLQEAGQNIVFSNTSQSEANNINAMNEESGFDGFVARPGDKVSFAAAYDNATGRFNLSNIQASRMGQEARGESYHNTSERMHKFVDDHGVHTEAQTIEGQTVLKTTTAGERADTGSRITTGDIKTIHEDRINYSTGVSANKPVLGTMLFNVSKAGFDLTDMTENESEMAALRTTASTTGVMAEIPNVKQLFDKESLIVGSGLGFAEGVSYLDIKGYIDSFRSTGKAEKINTGE